MQRLAGLTLTCALGLIACSETSGTGASGGSLGMGGVGGAGGAAGRAVSCPPTLDRCTSVSVEAHVLCCEQRVPEQDNACDGTESLVSPASCAATGDTRTYRLSFMELEEDCNVGYDLDGCNGELCITDNLTPGEGVDGVDNALAGLGPLAVGVGGDLANLNKLFSDALCGMSGEDCMLEIPPTEIRFVFEANLAEGCANLTVQSGGESSAHILNLSEDGCASGTLGTIPLVTSEVYTAMGGDYRAIDGSLTRTTLRMTVSPAGFSHGLLGAVTDADTAWQIFWVVFGGAADPTASWADINVSPPTTEGPSSACDGMSMTLRIAGVVE